MLRKYPSLNASFGGNMLLFHDFVNIGVAVAVEGGLLTPVVADCDRKSVAQIARDTRGSLRGMSPIHRALVLFAALALAALPRRAVVNAIDSVDYVLLSLPLLKRLGGVCVMYGHPEKTATRDPAPS